MSLNRHVALALGRLQRCVSICCWTLGLCFLTLVVIWSLATYTTMRYVDIEANVDQDAATRVISPEEARRNAVRQADARRAGEDAPPANVNRQLSTTDQHFRTLTGITGAIGTMAAFALIPVIGLGVIVGASHRIAGIDRSAGAFTWAVLLVALVLPWNRWFVGIGYAGVFPSYHQLIEAVTQREQGEGGLLFYAYFLALPLACTAGVAIIGLLFRSGIEAGLLPRESHHLDPELERETANIKASSLVGGGRMSGALYSSMQRDRTPDAPAAKPAVPVTIKPASSDQKPASDRQEPRLAPAAQRKTIEDNIPAEPRNLRSVSAGSPLKRPI